MDLPFLSIRARRLAQEYRQRWRRIGHQSARKRTTRWTRRYHRALVAVLVASFPIVLLGEALVDREEAAVQVNGRLVLMPERDFVATIVKPGTDPPWPASPWGEFKLDWLVQQRGWPFGSSLRRDPMRITLNEFNVAGTTLAVDHPKRASIQSAIEAAIQPSIEAGVTFADITDPKSHRSFSATTANFFIVLVTLACAAALATRGGELYERVRKDRRRLIGKERRQTGKCAECGYNLRGLDYHGRCPECGSLLH